MTYILRFLTFIRKDIVLASIRYIFTIIGRIVLSISIIGVILGSIGLLIQRQQGDISPLSHMGYLQNHIFGSYTGDNTILRITIHGIIAGQENNLDPILGLAGVSYGFDIQEQLYTMADNIDTFGKVSALLIDVDSPGGTIPGSIAIAQGIRYFKEKTGLPVITLISGLGASGGYWVAAASDTILAVPGSLVGSIGVIMGPFAYYNDVVEQGAGIFGGYVRTNGGINQEYIIGGKGKDLGNPFRQMTQEEKNILQKSINQEYDGFVQHVATRRDIAEDIIRNTIGAYIYSAKDALANGLIDGIYTKLDAYGYIAQDLGLEESWQVIDVQKSYSPLYRIFGPMVASNISHFIAANRQKSAISYNPLTYECSGFTNIFLYYGDISTVCTQSFYPQP